MLNRDVVNLLEQYVELQGASNYCPYLIADKCIIHTYKPTACQMFLPFEYKGKPMCFYLANQQGVIPERETFEKNMNSNCYAIHGCMFRLQSKIVGHLSVPYFKNIYAGTTWWKEHYPRLPANTRFCLESILDQDNVDKQLTNDFDFTTALVAGEKTYLELCVNGQDSSDVGIKNEN